MAIQQSPHDQDKTTESKQQSSQSSSRAEAPPSNQVVQCATAAFVFAVATIVWVVRASDRMWCVCVSAHAAGRAHTSDKRRFGTRPKMKRRGSKSSRSAVVRTLTEKDPDRSDKQAWPRVHESLCFMERSLVHKHTRISLSAGVRREGSSDERSLRALCASLPKRCTATLHGFHGAFSLAIFAFDRHSLRLLVNHSRAERMSGQQQASCFSQLK